ncbi:winged helix-turn-helix domain-containing protein [Actinocatenispora rupis]|uniref:HTH gntR-type domain-containing protein n=1 Tax=Actinocatenispora rupis TaxID=519421 RepID=A0A8J3J0I4_9ACTN|nr:winged helix-turn-helix domain-containing protein [Actinocatenispora rupis]GID09790.1 hypothetical protein Aru02nite_06790 [Actinocatenispora rupis]
MGVVDLDGLQPGAATPLYVQIHDAMKAAIESGEYAPGSRLPSETDVSQMTGVARLTVRKAYRLLADDGLVRTIPQRGTYVEPT